MGITFSSNRFGIGFNPGVQLNNFNPIHFGTVGKTDSFENRSVEKFFDENLIKGFLSNNSELKYLLSLYNLPIKLNMKELQELQKGHCKDTENICTDIYKNLIPSLKSQVNLKNLKEGALLHDFGKVLIPPEILNKNGSLNKFEHEIMDLHSEIGYQILKNSGLDKGVLRLIRYHHNSQLSDVPDINLEILGLADKYSALTEKRVYKDAYTPKQALTILQKEVNEGKIHPFIFKALVNAVKNAENNSNVKIS